MQKVNLHDAFALFSEYWQPHDGGRVNDTTIRLTKLKGEFLWHSHEHEDEMFLVVKGHLTLRMRDRDVHLQEGEYFIMPRGVEHQPVADEEAHVLLIEPASTVNTGNVVNERTRQLIPLEMDHG